MEILALMVLAGSAIGLFYFGGLWLTLNYLQKIKQWWLWLGGSFCLRVSLSLLCFWFLADGEWKRVAALAAGFTITRFFFIRKFKPRHLDRV